VKPQEISIGLPATGAAEAQVAVKRDHAQNIVATVEYVKDGPEGETFASSLEVVDVGVDDDGDPITSCIVTPATAEPTTTTGGALKPNQQTMLTILAEGGPSGMTVEEWNERARAVGIGVKRKQDLYDIRMRLKGRFVHTTGDRWYVTNI